MGLEIRQQVPIRVHYNGILYKRMVFNNSRKASRTWLGNQPGTPKNADLR
jgi:hypothetical protein